MPDVSTGSFASQSALVRAAAYARMSTDHQVYSIENQMAAIREYAAVHGMSVVREYADPGRSGLDLKGRPALAQLLGDVQEGRADYSVVLVYDVSRWGRFQDIDESAFYEFACRRANIGIVYCAEPFDNEHGGSLASIIKNIKRIMAAEYSREQSNRVCRAARYVAVKGFHAAGQVPYGYRRMLVGTDGTQGLILERGMRKALSGERIILVPGPAHEQRLVRRIFRLYAQSHLTSAAIAARLNREGKCNIRGRPWKKATISSMLINEVYLGTSIYSRSTQRLKGLRQKNELSTWVRVEKAFDPIVTAELFAAVQAERQARSYEHHTKEELLNRLRKLWKRRGRLSLTIMRQVRGFPSARIFRYHFGGMRAAYSLIGFEARHHEARLFLDQHLYRVASSVRLRLVDAVRAAGGQADIERKRGGIVMINRKRRVAVYTARYVLSAPDSRELWTANTKPNRNASHTLIIRMDRKNDEVMDYFLFPKSGVQSRRTTFHADNLAEREQYRCPSFGAILNRLGMPVMSL
jgi:DNA invertase Pin-like site-specific DNA recombinase